MVDALVEHKKTVGALPFCRGGEATALPPGGVDQGAAALTNKHDDSDSEGADALMPRVVFADASQEDAAKIKQREDRRALGA